MYKQITICKINKIYECKVQHREYNQYDNFKWIIIYKNIESISYNLNSYNIANQL